MIRYRLLFFFISLFTINSLAAQETWSLEKCVEYAVQNNLMIRQSQIAVSLAELDKRTNRAERLPNLNGSGDLVYQNGRTLDPTTSSFVNRDLLASSVGLVTSGIIYNGGRIKNQIAKSEYDLMAAKEDVNTQMQTMALQIASAYLNVLLAKEQTTIAEKAIEQTQTQLTQIDKRIDAGVLPKVERLDILSQIARNEQTLIQSKNNVDFNLLTLKNLLELDPNLDIDVIVPAEILEIEVNPEAYSFEMVYAQALENQASIKAGAARMKSAELDEEIAKSLGLPTLSYFGRLDTRWSNASKIVDGFGAPFVEIQEVVINQEPATIGFQRVDPILANNPYFDQLDQNFGQTIGISLNVPIYNRDRTKINQERARLGIINAELQNGLIKQQIKADVQQAIANARAASTELAASNKTLEAAKASFSNASKRYELGAINSLELTTAKTALDTAELNLIRAKYEYVFRLKVIDFYLGEELKLN